MFGILLLYGAFAALFFPDFYARFGINHTIASYLGLVLLFAGLVLFVVAYTFLRRYRVEVEGESFRSVFGVADKALGEVSDSRDFLGLMKANRKQMDAYDCLARSQARGSYRASLIAMGVGLGTVIAGMSVAVFSPSASTKYAAAIITAVGTATGGYISRTFIDLQERSTRQMNYYFQQPLVHSYLLSAERLIDLLPEDRRAAQMEKTIVAVLEQATRLNATSNGQARGTAGRYFRTSRRGQVASTTGNQTNSSPE